MSVRDAPPILGNCPGWNGTQRMFPTFQFAWATGHGLSVDNGTLYDVSAWDSWSLRVFSGPACPALELGVAWADDLSQLSVTAAPGLFELPANAGEIHIVGRVLSPLFGLTVASLAAIPAGAFAISMQFSNRTRVYDAPYTPEPLGTIIANIPIGNVAAAGNVTVAVPFYLGPARLAAYMDKAAGGQCLVYDDTAAGNVLAELIDTSPDTADLWIPTVIPPGTKWQLRVNNTAAVPIRLGASLTAA